MTIRSAGVFATFTTLLLLLAGCAAANPTTAPTPTVSPVPTETLPVSDGRQLFVSKGCAACHGQVGEGTGIAPALAGHTPDQTKRQIRAPLGLMPVFPPDKVSDAEMEEIAEYVAGLSGGHGHGRAINVGDSLAQHHWMALFALEEENQDEALHHINHIMELVSGDHLARMQEALRETETGRFHDSAHIVEQMLAGIASLELTERNMHLRLAISAVRVGETAESIHHMDHYLELAGEGSQESKAAQKILELLKGGELAEAEHEMSQMAGVEAERHNEPGGQRQEGG